MQLEPEAPSPAFKHLDWNLLRTFAVIVQTGGISKAANNLNLAQPTISNALRRLEERIGHKLIRRGGSVFEVTAEGRMLYRECTEIMARLERVSESFADISREIGGTVKLALASHVECPYFDEALDRFHRLYPNIQFTVEVDKSIDIIDSIHRQVFSAGVCLVFQKKEHLSYTHVMREHFGLFCGHRHPLFGSENLKIEDLKHENFVSFQTDTMGDALWPVALLRLQNEISGSIVGVAPNLEEVRRMILLGWGIGPLPVHVVKKDVESGHLWPLPPYDNLPSIDVHLVTNPNCNFSRAERMFIDHISSVFKDLSLEQRTFPQGG